jgi:hypothetical protein
LERPVVLGGLPGVVARRGERAVGVVQSRGRAVSVPLGAPDRVSGSLGCVTGLGLGVPQCLEPGSLAFSLGLSLTVPLLRIPRA